MHHVQNSQEWYVPFVGSIKLPEPLSLHGLMLFIGSTFVFILFGVLYNHKQRVPTGLTNLLESFVVFIRDDIAVPSLGKEDGIKMTPLFCTFFFFILGLNLMGLIPLFATATSNVNVTAALALITFVFMIGGAIYKNGIGGFFHALIPSGVPAPLIILLFPIEFAGLFIKTFALMIRLFANLLAGHIVIMSLLGLGIILGYASLLFLFPVAVGIYMLEVFVAFLQAYVFTLLSAMFIGQMYHPSH
jgi:F-type H+-transporting ATPase subunit a